MVTIMKATPVVRSASTPMTSAEQRAGSDAGGKTRRHAPAEMQHRQAGAVEAGREEHRVAEAEQAGIAEQEVVAHGEDRQHHDARQHPVVVFGQHELQREQQA